MVNLPYTMPDNLEEAKALAESLRSESFLAFDLEFDREQYTYGFTLCLMQIASPGQVALIDPLIPGLSDLFLFLLQQSNAVKLVHSSGEDMRLLHSLGCFPANVEDTEIYARWLNLENTSLSYLLAEFCHVALNKKQQRSNWTKRPLTTDQLHYACEDVQHLFLLREKLRAAAEESNVLHLAEEDIAIQAGMRYDEIMPYPYLKQTDVSRYAPYELYVLNGMMKLRDEVARKINKPQHFIVPEPVLKKAVLELKDIKSLYENKTVHRVMKSTKTLHRWQQIMNELFAQAEDLGLPKKMAQKANGYAYHQMIYAQEAALKSIQELLKEKFGEHTARYILSNRTAASLLKKEQTLAALNHPLKQKLIRDSAATLGVDMQRWL